VNKAESFLQAYKKAVYEKDVAAFTALFAADILVFDMWGSWTIEGIAAWKKMAEHWFGSLGEERVRVDYEAVNERGPLITAILKFTALNAAGEELRSLQNRITWVIENGKIVHEHTSSPIDHATMKPILSRT
jgi:ketosteroid isomerase-like protein